MTQPHVDGYKRCLDWNDDMTNIPESLVQAYAHGRLLPVIGRGLQDCPSWTEVLQGLAPEDSREEIDALLERGRADVVLAHLRHAVGAEALAEAVAVRGEPTEAYKQLAKLAVRGYFPAWRDETLQAALEVADRDPRFVVPVWRRGEKPRRPNGRGPSIVEVLGGGSRAEQWMFGRGDQRRLAVPPAGPRSPLTAVFQGKTLLLLGFEPNDPDLALLRILLPIPPGIGGPGAWYIHSGMSRIEKDVWAREYRIAVADLDVVELLTHLAGVEPAPALAARPAAPKKERPAKAKAKAKSPDDADEQKTDDDATEAGGESRSSRRRRKRKLKLDPVPEVTEEGVIGTLASWKEGKRSGVWYGNIDREDGGERIYADGRAVAEGDAERMRPGAKVSVDLGTSRKGPQAVTLRVVEDGPPLPPEDEAAPAAASEQAEEPPAAGDTAPEASTEAPAPAEAAAPDEAAADSTPEDTGAEDAAPTESVEEPEAAPEQASEEAASPAEATEAPEGESAAEAAAEGESED